MTYKQLNIINAALQLFADEGFHAVSTSKIAKAAEVSEGLIFRHFNNKSGLLEAIMQQAEEKLGELIIGILTETEPEVVIRKSILLPFNVKQKDYPFWQLQFKLKWQAAYNNPNKIKPWLDKLSWAFEQLNDQAPTMEALKLSLLIESISIQLLRNELKNKNDFKTFLLQSYNL